MRTAGHKRTFATGLELQVCFPLAGLKNSRCGVRRQLRPEAEAKGRKGGRSHSNWLSAGWKKAC
jgi:hypothetical protein